MVLRYKGIWVKTDKNKWKEQSFQEKLKCVKQYFSDESKYIFGKIKDYWIGYVDISKQDILCGGYGSDEPSHTELYYISIICGRFHKGQWFSHIGKDTVEKLINDWEFSKNKKFHLHLDLGGFAYQQYTFSKRQKDMLIEKLKPLLEMKWHK